MVNTTQSIMSHLGKDTPIKSFSVSPDCRSVKNKMGKREWPSYMLNYQSQYERPIDYYKAPSPDFRKKKKKHFLDGIDKNFLLTE